MLFAAVRGCAHERGDEQAALSTVEKICSFIRWFTPAISSDDFLSARTARRSCSTKQHTLTLENTTSTIGAASSICGTRWPLDSGRYDVRRFRSLRVPVQHRDANRRLETAYSLAPRGQRSLRRRCCSGMRSGGAAGPFAREEPRLTPGGARNPGAKRATLRSGVTRRSTWNGRKRTKKRPAIQNPTHSNRSVADFETGRPCVRHRWPCPPPARL
jgi:hypothetical protein